MLFKSVSGLKPDYYSKKDEGKENWKQTFCTCMYTMDFISFSLSLTECYKYYLMIYYFLELPCNLPQIDVLKVFHIFWEAIKFLNLVVTEM